MAGKKGMRHYPLEFRQMIVDLHLKEGVGTQELCLRYELHRSQVKAWSRWQLEFGTPEKPQLKPKGRAKSTGETDKEKIARLEMENALLKKFHELLGEERKRK